MAVPAAPILTGTVAVSLAIGLVAVAWSSLTAILLLLGTWAALVAVFILVCWLDKITEA